MKETEAQVLKITNVRKVFGKLAAVDVVSLGIKKGEILALIGPNGAGKTTLIKTVTGLYPPTAGKIEINGFDVWKQPVQAKKGMGYIPDEPWTYPYLTAREFLELNIKLREMETTFGHEQINRYAKLYGIEALLDGRMADFSRGNKQKVVIVAALIHKPQLLVIDEPIVGLDTSSQEITKKLLTDFTAKGGSVLVCTHTLPLVQAIASRVAILNQGKLLCEGTIKDLITTYHKQGKSLEEIYLALTDV